MTANGSKRWFGYVADNGQNFGYELDESTYESANLGMPAVAADAIPMKLTSDRPLRARRVRCVRVANDETFRATFIVGTRAAYDTLLASGVLTVDGTAWSILTAFGEVREYIPSTDTAILDGDVDANFAA